MSPPLFSWISIYIPSVTYVFLSLTACDGVVYKHMKFKGGGLVQHQPSAKDHQTEGLGPELRFLCGGIYSYFNLVSYGYGGAVVGGSRY